MKINIKDEILETMINNNIPNDKIQLPDAEIDLLKIKVMMINEVPPQNPDDWFYSKVENPDYMKTTLSLFRAAGVNVNSIEDILNLGIYITTAVKSPKASYTVDKDIIKKHLPILESEINLFPNIKVIMLMGDVAKKSVNMIAKAKTKKNIIPSESTYKIRGNEYYFGDIRVFPSYIMTGGNILIEKSKCDMISDDIRRMIEILDRN